MANDWPEIPYPAWRDTCAALHLFSQIVGKYRLARTPWVNHSWHATLYVGARGLTTSAVADGPGAIEIRLDLIDHRVIAEASDGRTAWFALQPMSVAQFHQRFTEILQAVGGSPHFDGRPNEIADSVPFLEDTAARPYDAEAVNRFFRALVQVDRVLKHFRTGFLGKVSPVHLFWGSFDLAVTRFSGRTAPLHPGGVPNLPDIVTQEAYSHEVSSAGFWPGGGGVDFPAFYAYGYSAPAGFSEARVAPEQGYFDKALGEFILPYDAVRQAVDPDAMLMAFLETTYAAEAEGAGWDRANLECATGEPLRPRAT